MMCWIQIFILFAAYGAAAETILLRGSNSTRTMSHNESLTYSGYTMGLQQCKGSMVWTLHGLWPQKENCGGEDFDESEISDLLTEMETYWLSCPEYSSSNKEFWSHEWSKHGSCSGLSQHEFFSDGLSLRSKYVSLCESRVSEATSCSLDCGGPTGPCKA